MSTCIRLFPQSATIIFPLESTATPVGALNWPFPSPLDPNFNMNSPSWLNTYIIKKNRDRVNKGLVQTLSKPLLIWTAEAVQFIATGITGGNYTSKAEESELNAPKSLLPSG